MARTDSSSGALERKALSATVAPRREAPSVASGTRDAARQRRIDEARRAPSSPDALQLSAAYAFGAVIAFESGRTRSLEVTLASACN